MSDIADEAEEEPEQEPEPKPPVYISPYNLEYFLEHFEDVCAEDFEGFTQRHFDRIGNMFFAPIKPENPNGAVKSLTSLRILCECGSTINKSSMKSHIKTKKHLDLINKVQTQNADDNICIPLLV
jgi:hypothetical protein